MTLNQIREAAGLTPLAPHYTATVLPHGGGSLVSKSLFGNPAVRRNRQLRQPTRYADLSPRRRTQVVRLLMDLSGDEALRRWVRHDQCACRWYAIKAALWGYVTGELQPAGPRCRSAARHSNPYAPFERRSSRTAA